MERIFQKDNCWKPPRLCHHPDDYPHVAPFLAIENFISNPVHCPTFCFSPDAAANIVFVQEIKQILVRLDDFIARNNLHKHPCLISQAGAQSTMRLATKVELSGDWTSYVEMPFCLHITETGWCSRVFDIEDLHKQVQWLLIFEQVLLPLNNMDEHELLMIAPHQHSDIVKKALMKSKKEKVKKFNMPHRFRESHINGYS